MIWYKEKNNDIAVSTRIRLARNIEGVPFPNALKDKTETENKIKDAVLKGGKNFEFIALDDIKPEIRTALAEEHLISPQMLDGAGKAILLNKDRTASVMLMEEDHIRLQVIEPGLAIDEAYALADKIDDLIETGVNYAFDEEFGYLTACPTNTGTGMRASVMMHLPALTMTRNIARVAASAGNLGIAVRGMYGEGTEADGNMYQISNQVTMGLTEKEILEKLKTIVNQIIDMEKKAREALAKNNADELSDRLFRSYGTLKYARSISSKEAKSLLSDVMLGQNMGILPKEGKITPLECIVRIAPSFISAGTSMTPAERDKKRADFIRDNI